MTSERGVLSFLFFSLGPPGVSKAANASYMYGGGERKERGGEEEEGKGREKGELEKRG